MTQLFLTIGRAIYVDLAEISAIEALSDDTCSITVGTFRYGVKRSAFDLSEIVSLAKRDRVDCEKT